MSCVHLQKLFQLCQENELRISSSDLVHVVCDRCQKDEVCPTLLFQQYEARHPEQETGNESQAIKPELKEESRG